jgi:hypothetical protein
MSDSTDLKIWACGGTGINVSAEAKAKPLTQAIKDAHVIGLDSSDANDSSDLFEIHRIAGLQGAGKDANKIMDKVRPFVKALVASEKPGNHNIVVVNISGGTGRGMAFQLVRELIEKEAIVILAMISDFTSVTEKENSVKQRTALVNMINQLGKPICFMEFTEDADKTRGEVNAEVIQGIALASVFLSKYKSEMEVSDLTNLFNYSYDNKVPPALSRIQFYDEVTSKEYNGPTPVAVGSLFIDNASVRQVFPGTVYRSTGILNKKNNPPGDLKELHLTLDHGEAYAALQEEIKALADDKAQLAARFVSQKDMSAGAADDGFC